MTRLLLIAFACIVLASAVQPQKDEERKTCDVGEDGNCVSDNCVDNFEKCPEWAEQGECGSNPFYMMLQCKKSCNTCSFDPLELDKRIEYASRLHKVGGDAELLETEYGIAQDPPQGYSQAMVDSVTAEMKAYMDTVYSDPELHELMDLCKNRKRNCLRWKLDGRCAESDELKKMCAPFCKACQLLDYKFRCPINESIPVALKPGDLDKLFQRIVTDQYLKKFNPTILSMPNATSPEIVNGPWIVTLDDFLSDQEADQFIELGAGQSFRRSADVSGLRFDGKFQSKVSDHRTSTNAWCYPPCEYNATTIEVTQRIVHLTGITAENFEWYQLLRYEVNSLRLCT
jgi:prolyl 4-hydroxylase